MTVGQRTAISWQEEVRRLAQERDAVILAHNYQEPAIQDVADHVGDSLALSRIAASTRSRVPASTFGRSFATRDTVWPDTPASRATSAIEGPR